jgi:hypothetical protein
VGRDVSAFFKSTLCMFIAVVFFFLMLYNIYALFFFDFSWAHGAGAVLCGITSGVALMMDSD